MAVYKFVLSVYGRNSEQYLRYKEKKKKNKKRAKATQLQNRTFIEERPKITEKRERFGDFEGDPIVSGKNGKGVLLVLCERKARYTVIEKVLSQSPLIINQYIKKITGGFICFSSLTLDNDVSFRKHEELSKIIDAPVYFCHPYHSREKGGVENTNKLIRQYIPKGSDISKYSEEEIKKIEEKLNNRPKKCLGYKTPKEVMEKNNQFKISKSFNFNFLINKNTQVLHLGA